MKSFARLSLIVLMALSLVATAEANSKTSGHKRASQYLAKSKTAQKGKTKKNREVASVKNKKKHKTKKHHH